MPRPARYRLASATVISPKWNTEAASSASARPCSMPSARCSSLPTPPLAMTGTGTASLTARVSARSNPLFVPSRSMLVRRISPAPRVAMVRAHSTASSPRALRPPCVYTSQRPAPALLASIATTIAWEPKRRAPFTTRPPCTSRQGMMRLARPTSALAGRHLQRLGEVELAFVDRAPRDAARDALAFHVAEPAHVVERREAAARDDGHRERSCETHGRLDVYPGHHPVASDVGVDH